MDDDIVMADPYSRAVGSSRVSQPQLSLQAPSAASHVNKASSSKVRKRPAKLTLVPAPSAKRDSPVAPASRSVPASPIMTNELEYGDADGGSGPGREDLRDTLRGTPRRRPSVLFAAARAPPLPTLSIPPRTGVAPYKPKLQFYQTPQQYSQQQSQPRQQRQSQSQETPWTGALAPPSVWQDPSEHILSGNGSSLQHARSCYASGPIEVLPGLFLGDEFNARDENTLAQLGITTILNVAKETTLPCQEDESSRDLGFLQQSINLSNGLERRLHLHDDAATPTSARPEDRSTFSSPPKTAFYSPLTSVPPMLPSPHEAPVTLPPSASPSRRSSLCLRNTSSTPNLNGVFRSTGRLPGAYRSEHDSSDEEEEEVKEEEEEVRFKEDDFSAGSNSMASRASPMAQDDGRKLSPDSDLDASTPSSSTFSRRSPATANDTSTVSSSSGGSYTIALPDDAVALSVPPPTSAESGRTWPIRYVKLPWTHDETELASLSSTGGFVTGCAIIADALGIDLRNGQMTASRRSSTNMAGASNNAGLASGRGGGGVLVHCQCGVSRSATMVIAFVMQAAAYEYDFEGVRQLTGMHDCYEMVKGLSGSISPNISLIYQLVEWERLLSGQAVLLRDEDANSEARRAAGAPPADDATASGVPPLTAASTAVAFAAADLSRAPRAPERRWGKEVMGEEDWMRMRAEEERKEKEEEEQREAVLRQAQAAAAASNDSEGKAAPKQLKVGDGVALNGIASSSGVGARRKKPLPSLTLSSSSKTNADKALGRAAIGNHASLPVLSLPDQEEAEKAEQSEELQSQAIMAPLDNSIPKGILRTPSGLTTARESLTPSPSSVGGEHANAADGPSSSLQAPAVRPKSVVFPWLQGRVPGSRPSSRPGSGYGAAAFGALGQSAAERRIKHKRTFSAEVPDWNVRQSVLTRSKTDGSRLSLLATSGSAADMAVDGSSGANSEDEPATHPLPIGGR